MKHVKNNGGNELILDRRVMSPRCKRYKNVFVAPASDLWKAIENKDSKKAEELYKEALKKAREYEVIE